MIWPTLYFPIFLTDCDFSIKEIYQVFIQAYKRRNFQSWTIRFDPYRPFKKKNYQTAFELRCTSQNFYPETLLLNHITLWSISYKFHTVFLFLSAVFFYSIYTILNKFESGTIRVDPHSYFLKNDQFLSKAYMVRIALYFHFVLNGSFFYFEIFLTNASHGKYGLTRILHFN